MAVMGEKVHGPVGVQPVSSHFSNDVPLSTAPCCPVTPSPRAIPKACPNPTGLTSYQLGGHPCPTCEGSTWGQSIPQKQGWALLWAQ